MRAPKGATAIPRSRWLWSSRILHGGGRVSNTILLRSLPRRDSLAWLAPPRARQGPLGFVGIARQAAVIAALKDPLLEMATLTTFRCAERARAFASVWPCSRVLR